MSIIDVFTEEKKESEVTVKSVTFLRSFFSFIYTRLCILFLLALDVIWFVFLLCKMTIYGCVQLVFMGSSTALRTRLVKSCASIKRSLVCGLCLLISLFSPALGIMFGCAYFLMYDKTGVEDVVPNVLREQFNELLSRQEKDHGLGR
ncbi:MAG: hypothetical protein V4489_10455 [Chlamydiota bacterium]